MMRLFNRFSIDVDIDAVESYVSRHLKAFIGAAIALVALVSVVALTVFFISVRGAERTLVPDVTGTELTAALLKLQDKELYPRIQLRYSQSAADKGQVLEQSPAPGTIVKAGRRIRLVVSRGIILDQVENYLGQNIDDVKIHLQSLFSTSARPLLSVREPVIYKNGPEAAGTILQQKPEPGYAINGPTQLEFVVSRGPENAMVKVPDLTKLPLLDALEVIAKSGIQFTVEVRAVKSGENPETVVSQVPGAGTVIAANTRVSLVVAAPASVPKGEVFGLFSRSLPEYAYPLNIKLEALLPTGKRQKLFSAEHPGGAFSIPYHLPEGSVLILTVLNKEEAREEATPFGAQ